jgi:hypothetical protein
MKNDFDTEAKVITDELKQAAGYLDCEKVILHHLKKQVTKGCSDATIEAYMKKLFNFFEARIKATQNRADCVNDRYASGFLNTLISTPYWHIWIKASNL